MLKSLLMILMIVFMASFSIIASENTVEMLTADTHISYDFTEGYFRSHGNARFEYDDLLIEADTITVFYKENRIVADGDEITIYFYDQFIEGTFLDFNYSTMSGFIADASTDIDSIKFRGKKIKLYSDEEYDYSIEDANITPCSLPNPHYSFDVGEIKIYPEDKIVARNLWLRVGPYRVLYLPNYTARFNPYTREYDRITPIPRVGYNSSDGFIINLAYPYQITENFSGEVNAEINQHGDKGIELKNNYILNSNLIILNEYIYETITEEDVKDISSEISFGFQYKNQGFEISPVFIYDFYSDDMNLDINSSYDYKNISLKYYNRYINKELARQAYIMNYAGRFPLELVYRKGYSIDYKPYLKITNLAPKTWESIENSSLGIGRVSQSKQTANKFDFDISLNHNFLSAEDYDIDIMSGLNSNIYFKDFNIHDYYNYYFLGFKGKYRQQITNNIMARYSLAYDYTWDDGKAYLEHDLRETGQSISPAITLRYDIPENQSAWVFKAQGQYQFEENEFEKMGFRLTRELDCFSYYLEVDLLDFSFGIDFSF
ncbi:hypothetical protein [Natronospora cellulosivora (SeqCode)]